MQPLTGDFAGVHASNISSSGVGPDLITITVGPQYKWVLPSHEDRHNVALFGHFLMGEAYASTASSLGLSVAEARPSCTAKGARLNRQHIMPRSGQGHDHPRCVLDRRCILRFTVYRHMCCTGRRRQRHVRHDTFRHVYRNLHA